MIGVGLETAREISKPRTIEINLFARMDLCLIFLVCLPSLVMGDNSTIVEDVSEVSIAENNLDADTADSGITWGEWSAWSKWSACTRSCGGGVSRQQRRCRRKPCKGKSWSTKYKLCNTQPCEKHGDYRTEQCSAFDDIPYSGQLFKWYPHHDPERPCSLICRGEPASMESSDSSASKIIAASEESLSSTGSEERSVLRNYGESDEIVVVQLADRVEDGTKCYPEGQDVCISGNCMKVGCDLRVGSNKNTDACGVCGGNGSSCQSRYTWSLESISACSKSCGGGFKIGMPVCKAGSGHGPSNGPKATVVDDIYCDSDDKPEKKLIPCNAHPCVTKWVTGEWGKCSASCGSGTKTRAVFCTEENGNETTKLPDHKCNASNMPRSQEACSSVDCPTWEAKKWSECSVTCGVGVRKRVVECRDGNGRISTDCDSSTRPRSEQECKTKLVCATSEEEYPQPMMLAYQAAPVAEKLIDQSMPSEETFIADKWSSCSVSCGEGVRRREVHCKILLEFSQTIAKLPDRQCKGPKPAEIEKCVMPACASLDNNLSYRIDTVGDSAYAESSLMDSFRSSAGDSGSVSGFEGPIKVAPGTDVQTTYSWKEAGYTPCSATCLGGTQELIINCIRDDTGKNVTPLLCNAATKPTSRMRQCNDVPCPPRWNYSEFSPCMSPCGLGIQTRDVTCIHEVTRDTGKTVAVPNYLCPQPPPADRQYCNVWDCPIQWESGEWGKCSKSCGGGVKRRKVTCEQVMAQGRKQNRDERECPPPRPSNEKPCNTRPCHEMDMNVQPVILGQNSTYNQTDFNEKVDLRIGGHASVYQGMPFIKIRCPVKKFDKALISWTKDRKVLRKSSKYKMSKKGALKIVDITMVDSGIYACIAGQTRAETYLTVKLKPKDQLSSEEYLRLGNSVHLQKNSNFDSAPVNSGESIYTDRAAPYGGFGGIDSEDLSHERAVPSKTTRKPPKKPKPSPTPPASTMMQKEPTVTINNQPGHHESVESAASGASSLVPHLSYLISSLKNYWPFSNDDTTKNREATSFSSKHENSDNKHSSSETIIGEHGNQNIQKTSGGFDNLNLNTFFTSKSSAEGEKIFEDDGLYKKTNSNFKETSTTTDSDIDYVEESLKNVRDQWNSDSDLSKSQEDENFRTTIIDVRKKSHNSETTESSSHRTETLKSEDSYTNWSVDYKEKDIIELVNTTGQTEHESSIEHTSSSIIDSSTESILNQTQENKTTSNKTKENYQEKIISKIESTVLTGSFDGLIFEWVTTEWSKCSQTCGRAGFQMRGAQCTVRESSNATTSIMRSIVAGTLCEKDGQQMPQKVRPCGGGRCPQWHTTEWTPCESSRCFNWKTAMQRRDISCRLIVDTENGKRNITQLNISKCDDSTKPLQRQECYNDDCKGVWRVGEWSECAVPCEEDGIKYRILQCVWYGTKKPAGNACRDIPRPPVMKTCRGAPCTPTTVRSNVCKDQSQLCSSMKNTRMCFLPFYQKQCCASCH